MKKVLIISYYWPPSGGPGVQRWLKFAKYLSGFGWEATVVVPENPDYQLLDTSLISEIPKDTNVIKVPIREPFRFYRRLFQGNKSTDVGVALISSKKNTLKDKILFWIRGNIIIPDARRFWIRPVVKMLRKYLNENHIDVIVSNGPPHSLHLIAYRIKKEFNHIPWISDFRDPWTKIDFYQELKTTKLADNIQKRQERNVILSADRVITISESNSEDFREIKKDNVFTITNGFDHEDFDSISIEKLDDKFSISYIGNFTANRNPSIFWVALGELVKENDDFKKDIQIRFVGVVDFQVYEDIKNNGLDNFVEEIGYVSHSEAIRYQKSSRVLLLVINKSGNPKGILTGKLFEYLASGRPILLVGPTDGDAAKIIEKTESGLVCSAEEKSDIKKAVLKLYDNFKNNESAIKRNQEEINRFSRKGLTAQLVDIMNEMILK